MNSRVRLTKAARKQAEAMAESMICDGYGHRAVLAALASKFGIAPRTVERVVSSVYERWLEEDRSGRPRRRTEQRRRLLALRRDAIAKGQLSVAARLEELLARLDGTMEKELVPVVPFGCRVCAELDGRSEEALDHFLEHGCFPEDQSPSRLNLPTAIEPEDPLGNL